MHGPEDYLRTYRYLGTWAVLADEGHGANELHVVYASPGTVDTFQKSGQFPDDAVLVKEVSDAATGQMTTGMVGYAETLKGRSEEHTSELHSLMRISYAVFCSKINKTIEYIA